MNVIFGKDRYEYTLSILVLISEEVDQIIIGRVGFFEQFKIIFCEAERRITFKKIFPRQKFM